MVVPTDTDVLAMHIGRAQQNNSISVLHPVTCRTAGKMYAINEVQTAIEDMKDVIIFAHAVSGCDKTSALYRKGKKIVYTQLKENPTSRNKVFDLFNAPNQLQENVIQCGEEFDRYVYPNGPTFQDINELRHHLYNKAMARQSPFALLELSSLPPTKEASAQHSLRVYLQVQEWLGDRLPPTEWGCKLVEGQLLPVKTTLPPAPESLLSEVYCLCKINCAVRCSCRHSSQKCSTFCSPCNGETCNNIAEPVTQDSTVEEDF